MGLLNIFRPSRSIVSRLTWRITVATIISLILILGLIFVLIYILGVAATGLIFGTAMEVTNEKMNTVFSNVEAVVRNNVPEAKKNIYQDDMLFSSVQHMLKLNEEIMGTAIAFNPDYEPKKGQRYAPYAFRTTTGIHTTQLNSRAYNYPEKEWFKKPVELKKACWSEPYVDEGGGGFPMITYSLPLINDKDEAYAVYTADLSLDWIETLRQKSDSAFNENFMDVFDNEAKSHFTSFLVTRQGTIVAHPDSSLVMKASLKDYFKNIKGKEKRKEKIIKDVLEIGTDDRLYRLYRDKNESYILMFAACVERTDWLMVVTLPVGDLLWLLNSMMIFMGFLSFIGIGIIVLACYFTVRKVTKPIRQFTVSADEIAKGNFTAELPKVKTKDEMRRLRDSFETMQLSLVKQIEETEAIIEDKGRIEGELQTARSIQMSMLPKTFPPYPDRDDIDIYGQLMPAKEVGGDLFDFFLRDEKLFFCIGDVSGKGVPASLLMAVTRSLFRTIASHESQPARIMTAINESISEDNESNMFVTLFIGVLDLPTGRMRYSNAGHDAPILIGDQGVGFLPCDPNLPVGIITDWKFTLQETVIDSQTTIFLYTDGLTEAENLRHEQFQEERVLDTACEAERKPEKFIEHMTKVVQDFVGNAEQSDDQTMLAIQYSKEQDDDMRLSRSLKLTNNVDEVPQLAAFVDEVCEAIGLDMSLTMSLNLAIEEAVVIVMDYAYPTGKKGDILIEAKANNQCLKIVIIDWGTPFDPTTKAEVDTTLSAEERPIGGLGIHLVRQIMDSINYERIDGKNVLTLRKKTV